MATQPVKRSLLVSGIQVNVYFHPSGEAGTLPVSVLFFLHGRTSSMEITEPIFRSLAMQAYDQNRKKDLYLVAIDERNHGTRLVDGHANLDWKEGNPNHAVDMYGIQLGAIRDGSHLIDILPAYLFPNDERRVTEWGIAGISLGGHASWLALAHEPRISYGVVILGCADYISLMSQRAESSGVNFGPPAFPSSLKHLVLRHDPVYTPYKQKGLGNPYFGKKILVLRGGLDELVPWSATEGFYEGVYGRDGYLGIRLSES